MASHVVSVYVVEEGEVIKHEFFAKITVWMGKDFTISVIANVAVFDVVSQRFNMIQSLLSNKHNSPF